MPHLSRFLIRRLIVLVLVLGVATTLERNAGAAPPKAVSGFTEPIRRIDLAALESGTLATLTVNKGERVESGAIVGRLDDDVLAASLELAKTRAAATAQMDAARIRLERAKQQRTRLETLYHEGHGGSEEIDEADADVALAETEVRAVEETQAAERVEIRRIEAQLKRRRVVAPFAGEVADLLKREGEFVAPGDAAVLTLVDLSRLRVHFYVPTDQAVQMKAGDSFSVRFPHSGLVETATVEFVSPLIYADSNTVHVDMLIDNAAHKMKAGRRCVLLDLPTERETTQATVSNGARR